MPAILEVKGLAKNYGDFTAVKGISFDIQAGEIFSLLGPNGAGKTTTSRPPAMPALPAIRWSGNRWRCAR
jgi:ABC-type multidrug transport system ATPase subunit